MEDISRKISEMLNDPRTMEQIRSLTGMLGNAPPPEPTVQPESVPSQESAAPALSSLLGAVGGSDGFDPNWIGTVMKLAPLLRSLNQEDDSTRLLKALKPFLHEERAQKVDGAVRLLGIMKLLPVLKNAGISLF